MYHLHFLKVWKPTAFYDPGHFPLESHFPSPWLRFSDTCVLCLIPFHPFQSHHFAFSPVISFFPFSSPTAIRASLLPTFQTLSLVCVCFWLFPSLSPALYSWSPQNSLIDHTTLSSQSLFKQLLPGLSRWKYHWKISERGKWNFKLKDSSSVLSPLILSTFPSP